MAYRWHGRARVNPDYPQAWAICDRCGFNYNLVDLQWQWDYGAGFQMYNKRILVCDECYDKPAQFLKTIIIPPDPPAIYNLRPEPYQIDERGPTQNLSAFLIWPESSVSVLYLDLFDGPPDEGGTSVLSTITGSSSRVNYVSSLGPVADLVTSNSSIINFASIAQESAAVSWLAAYDASTAGTLLSSAELFIPQTIVMGNGCQIDVGDLQIQVQLVITPDGFQPDAFQGTAFLIG